MQTTPELVETADDAPDRARAPETLGLRDPAPRPATEAAVLRFGTPGARPKAYLQAGLHADELPGMLVLRDLAERLGHAEERNEILGEILVLPVANPIGLRQRGFGILQGRFDAETGGNFNRDYADLGSEISGSVGATLGDDAEENVAAIRAAMSIALAGMTPRTEIDVLRHSLLKLAHDADYVLDLHADSHAEMHLYTGTPLWPDAADLAGELGARAVLVCEKSGGNPFDEACSAPWWELAAAHPEKPIPLACLAATVELRSNNDVDEAQIEADASALLRFLTRRGLLAGPSAEVPALECEATPLTAMQQVIAETEGVVLYHAELGADLSEGDLVASVIDPLGVSTQVLARTDGRLFARHAQPYAWPGKVIGKIAGSAPLPERAGRLLTD